MTTIETGAANAMLSALASLAASVELEGVDGIQPIRFGAPTDRTIRAATVIFDVPAFAVVAGYRVRSASGELLWQEAISPPESFGARGGFFELPDLSVSL